MYVFFNRLYIIFVVGTYVGIINYNIHVLIILDYIPVVNRLYEIAYGDHVFEQTVKLCVF